MWLLGLSGSLVRNRRVLVLMNVVVEWRAIVIFPGRLAELDAKTTYVLLARAGGRAGAGAARWGEKVPGRQLVIAMTLVMLVLLKIKLVCLRGLLVLMGMQVVLVVNMVRTAMHSLCEFDGSWMLIWLFCWMFVWVRLLVSDLIVMRSLSHMMALLGLLTVVELGRVVIARWKTLSSACGGDRLVAWLTIEC